MKNFSISLFLAVLFSFMTFAQTGSRSGVPDNGQTQPVYPPTDNVVIYSDDMNGANDTTSLKARGYLPYYRGTGPQGSTATWYQGVSSVFPAYNGPDTGYVAANYNVVTGANNIDSWLVFPALDLKAGDSLYFFERTSLNSTYPDSIRVMYSTSSNTPEGTWVELGRFKVTITGAWMRRGYAIPTASTTGRIAIRYCVVNGGPSGANSNYIGIDAISVERASGPVYNFFDNFDDLIAGQRLACQDSLNWTTWSNDPCNTTEDPFVSNVQSISNPNSVVIVQNNDLVKLHGDLSTGKWYTGFQFYIPTGKTGYFNMLSNFGSYWAFECYFNANGVGSFQTGDPDKPFTWQQNTWQWCEVVVDLDLDTAFFYMGGSVYGTLVHAWKWSNTQSAPGGPVIIDAHDFFGATANDQMYMDNFFIGPQTITPVELATFGASLNEAGQVVLHWSTATESNNQGFEVERKSANGEFLVIGHVRGHGTTTEMQNYSFVDASVVPGKYLYRLKQVDFSGAFEYSNAVEVEVTAPLSYNLAQNYPNPFNPSTLISYQIPEKNLVTLKVYDMIGNLVTTLVNNEQNAGSYQVTFDASQYTSGVYFYTITAGKFTSTKKLMLIK